MGRKSRMKKLKKKKEIENFVFNGIESHSDEMEKVLHIFAERIYGKYNNIQSYKEEVNKFLRKYIYEFQKNAIDDFIYDYHALEKPYLISEVTYNKVNLYRYMNEGEEYYKTNSNVSYLYSNPHGILGRVNNNNRRMLYTSNCPEIAYREAMISNETYSSIEYECKEKIKLLHLEFKKDIKENKFLELFNDFWPLLLINSNNDDFYYISNKVIDLFEEKLKADNFDGIIWKSYKYEHCVNEACTKENIALFQNSECKLIPKRVKINDKITFNIFITILNNKKDNQLDSSFFKFTIN